MNIVANYLTAAIFFFAISVLLWLAGDALVGHYFHPKVLAITHITTLGWISTIIIGSLYQLVPVISNKKIHSPQMALLSFILIIVGTGLLAYAFWTFNTGRAIQVAAGILLAGVTVLLINMLLTLKDTEEKNPEMDLILSSLLWFWLTAFIGTLLAFNFEFVFLPKEHLFYLRLHAHIGIIGWFICLIIGVASKLLPMFLLSSKPDLRFIRYSYFSINIGLLLFLIDALFFGGITRSEIYILVVVSGIVSFLVFIAKAFKTSARKKLDINLKHSYAAFIFFMIPILIWVILKLGFVTDAALNLQLTTAVAFSILFGFITFLILGQTFKNLAFIVWLKAYQEVSGKSKTPLPKDLYSEKLTRAQFYGFLASFSIILTGIILSAKTLIQVGSGILILTAILYNINVFKIAFHKRNITTP
ncbi:MAG: hypothetical protein K0R26_1578 [Bacteroidota bacterium]|nr:hypothetical protein [Bacteroidota bacterium]